MVSTGLRLVIGSWKIIAMWLPRTLRIASSGSVEQVAALEHDAALRCGRSTCGRSRMIDSAVTLLPEPDSPTIATVSRGADVEARCR